MPSVLAHVFLGLIVAYAFKLKPRSLVVLGSMLPDAKIFLYAIAAPVIGLDGANALIIPIHTPVGSILLCAFVASLPGRDRFMKYFSLLFVGMLGHYLLDSMMFPFNGIEHYLLLYPITWRIFGIEAIDLTHYFTFAGLIILAFFFGAKWLTGKRNIKKQENILP